MIIFFSISCSVDHKTKIFRIELNYKKIQLDNLLHKIFFKDENFKQPLSFHHFGFFTTKLVQINFSSKTLEEINQIIINDEINKCLILFETEIKKIVEQIITIDDYNQFISEWYNLHLQKNPHSKFNIYLESILAFITLDKLSDAKNILEYCKLNNIKSNFIIKGNDGFILIEDYIKLKASSIT